MVHSSYKIPLIYHRAVLLGVGTIISLPIINLGGYFITLRLKQIQSKNLARANLRRKCAQRRNTQLSTGIYNHGELISLLTVIRIIQNLIYHKLFFLVNRNHISTHHGQAEWKLSFRCHNRVDKLPATQTYDE
jgi:hypothetical protein